MPRPNRLVAALVLLAAVPAVAHAAATLRAGDHPGFGRIVIDTDGQTGYHLDRDGDHVLVRLTDGSALGIPPTPPRNVVAIHTSGATVELNLKHDAKVRPTQLSSRIIIDVLDPADASAGDAPSAAAAPVALPIIAPTVAPAVMPAPAVALAPAPAVALAPAAAAVAPAVAAPRRAAPASIPVAASTGLAGGALALEAGGGRVVRLPGAAASVFAADPKVAEARPASATSLFIFGVAPGRTTIAALDAAGATLAQFEVVVSPSAYGASEARAELGRLMPGSHLQIDTRPGGLSVSGEAATAAEAERAVSVVRSYTPSGQTVDNRITVVGPTQVNLRVRFIEVDRSVTRQLGLNWQALGSVGRFAVAAATNYSLAGATSSAVLGYRGAVNVNAIIDALAQDQLVTILAEPNLTAQSGETASFLAGGEFPIPVGQQGNTITIEFKQYGVSLAFVPTVLSGGHISLRVRPEVSQLTTQGAIQLSVNNSTLQIPALTVRRADTTVELGSGQSFAIGGLLQDSRTQTGSGIPGLGDVPVLGALFRSSKFQHDETELVIIITPYIVRPTSDPEALRGPDAATATPPSELQRNLLFRQYAGNSSTPPPPIPGDVGFVIQ